MRKVARALDFAEDQAVTLTLLPGAGSGPLVRGVDIWRHFAQEPTPRGDCEDADVSHRRDILNRYPENPLLGPLAPNEIPQFPDSDLL